MSVAAARSGVEDNADLAASTNSFTLICVGDLYYQGLMDPSCVCVLGLTTNHLLVWVSNRPTL